MNFRVMLAGAAALLLCGNAAAQLTCSTSASDQCDAFHYHAQAWNPETKQYVEIYGQSTFATMEACEKARKVESDLNMAAIAYLQIKAPRLKAAPGKFGACHCDMSGLKSHANFLDDDRRIAMMRRGRELKLAMVELLLDNDATLENEIVRAYLSDASSLTTSNAYWPREVRFLDLKGNKLLDESKTKLQATSISTTRVSGVVGASIELAPVDLTQQLLAADTPAEDAGLKNAEVAFLSAEMARMSSLLQKVSEGSVSGGDHLLEACNERIQVLTNLGKIAESGGERSRLADTMKSAASDTERAKLINALFGSYVAAHWAPASLSEMSFAIPQAIKSDPVAVLRDSSGRFTEDERKVALFALMASNSALTETEEIWLSGILDSSLVK